MSELVEHDSHLLYPLSAFYERAGRRLPVIEQIAGQVMPQPYRSLLVHRNDMTPTLEQYWGEPIHLRLLERIVEGDELLRRVTLVANGDERPVEFGAIRIHLNRFDPEPRRLIEANYRPLGTILAEFGIEHSSRPSAFIRIWSDELMNEALGLTGERELYGRCNVLYDADERPLAEVIEVLPPIEE